MAGLASGFLQLVGLEEALPDLPSRAERSAQASDGQAVHRQQTDGRQGFSGKPLVWVDCEMTGLDPEQDYIMEIACLVTDGNLGRIVEGPEIAIHLSDERLDSMNDWCKEHHGQSGLTEKCRASTVSLQQAEEQVVAFISQQVRRLPCQLAGSSVHQDLIFIRRGMPRLAALFHHRIVDVSSIAELCFRWYRSDFLRTREKSARTHTAMSDIKASLEELRWYKRQVFKTPAQLTAAARPEAVQQRLGGIQ